jgi:hypothetical protein
MNAEIKKVRKWFWVWDDDKEEAWLRKMANDGWNLIKVGLINSYEFELSQSKDLIYRIDYKDGYNLKLDEYIQIFADSGWEHICEMSGRHYFRTPMRGEDEPEIYSDNESKITKYQRILAGFYIFIPMFLFLIIYLPDKSKTLSSIFFDVFLIIIILLEIFFIFSVIKLTGRISQIKRL